MTFSDLTTTGITDPTNMNQLDVYRLGIQIPLASVALSSAFPISNATRMNVSVVWASMVDAPFQITPSLPAQ